MVLVPGATCAGPDGARHDGGGVGEEVLHGGHFGGEGVDGLGLIAREESKHVVCLVFWCWKYQLRDENSLSDDYCITYHCQYGSARYYVVGTDEDKVVWEVGCREGHVAFRLFGPGILQVRTPGSDDWESRSI